MIFQSVYYSHFWYSRFASMSLANLDGDFFHSEIKNHCNYFRLLALFFPHIYVPRTHLITQLFADQWEIPNELFKTDEFSFFCDVGTLKISTYPYLDEKEDNERIVQRSSLTDEVLYAASKNYLESIPATEKIAIYSRKESEGNLVSYPNYGRWLSAADPAVASKFLDIVTRSHLKDVPFFHESFVTQMKKQFDAATFNKIWRDTNSIYLITGAPSQLGGIPYFNQQIESIDYRFRPLDFDRYLLSPESLYTFLTLFFNQTEMSTFFHAPIKKVFGFLLNESNSLLDGFRKTFFELVSDISIYTRAPALRRVLDQTVIRELQNTALKKTLGENLTQAEGFIKDAKTLAGTIDGGTSAIVFSVAQVAAKYGRRPIEKIVQRYRYPELALFIRQMKHTLRSKD
jgi:hypothetical protein